MHPQANNKVAFSVVEKIQSKHVFDNINSFRHPVFYKEKQSYHYIKSKLNFPSSTNTLQNMIFNGISCHRDGLNYIKFSCRKFLN